MIVKEFDQIVCQKLGSYVYALRDLNGGVFYVGKGQANRCFQHLDEARKNIRGTIKLDTIRQIWSEGRDIQIDIVRHGLDEPTALEVEAALIDILKLKQGGGNLVSGHGHGMESATDIQIRYGAKPLVSNEPLLLIKINNTYKSGMTRNEVYEITRWAWKINLSRASRCAYVLGVAHGIVRGVFKPTSFRRVSDDEFRHPKDRDRIFFEGSVISDSHYLHTSIDAFSKKGQANPVVYWNL